MNFVMYKGEGDIESMKIKITSNLIYHFFGDCDYGRSSPTIDNETDKQSVSQVRMGD